MTKTVGIFLFDDVEVLDFAGPFEVFSVTGQLSEGQILKVVTIAKTIATVTAVNGLLVQPHYDITNHPPIDILVIPGGSGSRIVIEDKVIMDWMNAVYEQSELTLTICSGARIPASLGMLRGLPFCTHHEVYEHVMAIEPTAIPRPEERFVQTNDKLYTAAGISAGIDLSFHIVEKLFGESVATNTAVYMEYNH